MSKEKSTLIVEIKREGKRLNAYNVLTGELVPEKDEHIHWATRKDANAKDMYLALYPSPTKPGKTFWRRISKNVTINDYLEETNVTKPVAPTEPEVNTDYAKGIHSVKSKVKNAMKLKPVDLFMGELQWKFLTRSYYRGRNILLLGFTGCGKTKSAYSLANAVKKEVGKDFFVFNMGATQDPRATLIGNTHYNTKDGTFFSQSKFVRAIQIENAVILLDELSRINPEGANILMTVLDYNQRFLSLDEDEGSPMIKVAKGVTFVATANVGSEFTATRTLDRALYDRFTAQLEVPILDLKNETNLLRQYFPTLRKDVTEAVADVACYTRDNVKSDDPTLTTIISTRTDVEIASMLVDGLKFSETMEVAVLPLFDKEGGADSERTFIKQKVQQYSHLDKIKDYEVEDAPEPEEVEEPEEKVDNFDFEDEDELFDINDSF